MILDKISEASQFIKNSIVHDIPHVAFMMGSGMSGIADLLTDQETIDYGDIPHFPVSTVEGHKGKLVVGKLEDSPVLIFAGRWHYYEGYSMQEITFPVRVMKAIGVTTSIFTNASGGVNPNYRAGELVILRDHINMLPEHPLRGKNEPSLGLRFPDMKDTYDINIRKIFREAATEIGVNIEEGVYFALQGPSLETPSEYVMAHRLGADMVGMSTVPEVIVARHSGLRVGAISIATNICYPPEKLTITTMEEVIEVAGRSGAYLNKILGIALKKL